MRAMAKDKQNWK